MTARQRISSGGPWEESVGYSRAVRVGDRVWVSGTTGTHRNGDVPAGAAAQTRLALETIARALSDAGASIADVVHVRYYLIDFNDWDAIVPILREYFGAVRPAATAVQVARLLLPAHRIEIEADAVIGSA